MRRLRLFVVCAAAAAVFISPALIAQSENTLSPRVELIPAPLLRLTGDVDSNSPAIWDRVDGRTALHVVTSTAGRPSTAVGRQLRTLGAPQPIVMEPWPGGGIWMEAVIADVDGTWYGYYHNENAATQCETQRVIPRIGAARSHDEGATWEPLGIVLEAPLGSYDCDTNNHYFVGGVGDFSAQLDPESRDLYLFFSQYQRRERQQGVGVARLAWADRDAPVGKMTVWANRAWLPASKLKTNEGERWSFPSAVPIFPASESWHDGDDIVDAFWGPSVHWNTYLNQYVMLLNKAKDPNWSQEGIYVSFAPRIDDPRLWTQPVKVLEGGSWYPQVMGIEDGAGTDKTAGRLSRFFMSGSSRHFIQFIK